MVVNGEEKEYPRITEDVYCEILDLVQSDDKCQQSIRSFRLKK